MKIIFFTVLLLLATTFFLFPQTEDEIAVLLHEIDERSTRFNNRIVSISDEFNFGIPGGKNWLVEWEGHNPTIGIFTLKIVYVVDIETREIKFRHGFGPTVRGWVHPNASAFESLPGRTIGARQIGDFNGEGFDMILNLHIGGGGPGVDITVFNPQTGMMEWIFSENFDNRYENSPIRFIRYRGMYGFMVREGDPPQVAGGPTWVPEPNPRAGRWFFYTWDREQFTFVEIGEVDETYIEGDWRPGESPVVELIEQTAIEFSEVPNESETANITITPVVDDFAGNQPIQAPAVNVPQADFVTDGGGMLLWAWFAIIGGVVVAGGAVLVVVRRKKK